MNKKITDQNRIILTVFSVLSVFLIIFIIAITYRTDRASESVMREFAEGWSDPDGNITNIEYVRANDDGFSPAMTKTLPGDISDGDCLCFESYNVNVDVSVDGELVYAFKSKENLTGLGYGTAYHEVGLSSSMAGKTIQVIISRSNPEVKSKRGHIENVFLSGATAYVYKVMRSNLLTILSSGFILFFGIVFLLISFVISDNDRLPFDVASLGVSSIILGTWLLVLSNVFQLVSGHIYMARNLTGFSYLPPACRSYVFSIPLRSRRAGYFRS